MLLDDNDIIVGFLMGDISSNKYSFKNFIEEEKFNNKIGKEMFDFQNLILLTCENNHLINKKEASELTLLSTTSKCRKQGLAKH